MPKLARIAIHPVKSLDPVWVSQAKVLPSGALEHDRRFTLRDAAGNAINAKRNERVHLLRSGFDPLTRVWKLDSAIDGTAASFHLDHQRASLLAWLSNFFSGPVQLDENRVNGFPDDLDAPGPTLISTATLEVVASWFAVSTEEARLRFRANLEIDGVEPFWEDRLFAAAHQVVRFRIGEVTLEGTNPCQRCVVPTRHPHTADVTPRFAKIFAERRQAELPSWADSSRFNHYYRLSVNTRLSVENTGSHVGVSDELRMLGVYEK